MKAFSMRDWSMERRPHPLDLAGVEDVASSMVHDGDVEGAYELVCSALWDADHPARGIPRDDHEWNYWMLAGMNSALSGVLAHRKHERDKRADAKNRNLLSPRAARPRPLRSAS